jgi:chromosome segregation ATPase
MDPRSHGYPLATLERLRREIRERREQELAKTLQALAAAEQELERRRETRRGAERRLEQERARLVQVPASIAGELQRGRRYLERLGALLEARRAGCREAEAELARRAELRARAQAELARAQAELEALEKHHQGWDQVRRKLEERRAEQELEDLTAARHDPRRGG